MAEGKATRDAIEFLTDRLWNECVATADYVLDYLEESTKGGRPLISDSESSEIRRELIERFASKWEV